MGMKVYRLRLSSLLVNMIIDKFSVAADNEDEDLPLSSVK